jgi:hypothetical protein
VKRKDKDDWVAACREVVVDGARDREVVKMWNKYVVDDMRTLGLKRRMHRIEQGEGV